MLNSFIAFLLIMVSFLPGSSFRTNLETKLESRLFTDEESSRETVASNGFRISPLPEKSLSFTEISSNAGGAMFSDNTSGEILFEINAHKKLPMASITKLMTALITVEYTNPDDVVTVNSLPVQPLDTIMGLSVGDKLTVKELLHGLLIESGADASLALSGHIAGNDQKFAALMNERASKLGLTETQFTNSIGHDESGHYSTPADLTKLARVALTNPIIAEIVAKKSYVATGVTGKKYYLSNTNLLLDNQNYKGIKTGTTFAAGQCLLSLYDDGTRRIIGVLLGSPSRFTETSGIIEWTKRSFTW